MEYPQKRRETKDLSISISKKAPNIDDIFEGLIELK
jgi:hypothetical protein